MSISGRFFCIFQEQAVLCCAWSGKICGFKSRTRCGFDAIFYSLSDAWDPLVSCRGWASFWPGWFGARVPTAWSFSWGRRCLQVRNSVKSETQFKFPQFNWHQSGQDFVCNCGACPHRIAEQCRSWTDVTQGRSSNAAARDSERIPHSPSSRMMLTHQYQTVFGV